MADLFALVKSEPSLEGLDVALLTGDNGADYAVDCAVVQHMLGRLFPEKGLALLITTAHAPYHSSWHSEIEPQWAVARRLIAGQHFGRSGVATDEDH